MVSEMEIGSFYQVIERLSPFLIAEYLMKVHAVLFSVGVWDSVASWCNEAVAQSEYGHG